MICFHIRSTFSSNILDFKIKVGKQKFRFRYLIDKQLKFALNDGTSILVALSFRSLSSSPFIQCKFQLEIIK